MFGEWVQRRRKILDLTQAELARMVSCSLSMLRKIEREERRPSDQLAELLADRLSIGETQRKSFLQLARGKYVSDLLDPDRDHGALIPFSGDFSEPPEGGATFVARERELFLLTQHLHRALQGQGGIVFVAGEAGRGKTSLLVEFARRSLANRPDLLVAGGNCDVFTGQGDPLLPFRDIFRLLAGDWENAGLRAILNHELARRLSDAIPMITEILLENGPDLIDKLVPGGVLESHLASGLPRLTENTELLVRLRNLRSRPSRVSLPEQRQDSLFDEISTTLNALSRRRPLLLVLDDLHWIEHSSAALLGRLPRRLKDSPILIVGSYRPEELFQQPVSAPGAEGPVQHPLNEVLSESLRLFGHNRIDLDHVGPGEELALINAILDASENTFSATFREQLARLTEGHPLFVVELLRDMKERGDILQTEDGRWYEQKALGWKNLPARVEGVIEKRVSSLPFELSDLLAVASVQGETFYAEVIAIVMQTSPQGLIRRLSAQLDRQHRLIKEQGVKRVEKQRLSQYQFRHHLFQKYQYERLSDAERVYLHEAVGNALEAIFIDVSDPNDLPSAQLARHYQEARMHEKASRYLLRAGRRAARLLAYEEAANHFEHGLAEIRHLARDPQVSRLEYDLSLGLARSRWHAGQVGKSVAAYTGTIEIARTLQDPEALARAVLAYEEPRWRLNLDAERSERFIREALELIEEQESGLRVRLLVNLARSLLTSGAREELRTTVEQALEMARRIGDPLALCEALRIKVQIDRRPETTAARLAAIKEMIATAESIPDQERLADGLDLYVYDLLELGQIEQVDETIAVQKQVASEIKQPFQLHVAAVFETMRAIMQGEFEAAERLAKQAADLSRQIGLAEMDGIYGIQMFTIRREQDRIHEIAPLVKLAVANSPRASAWRPGLALIYSLLDERVACREIFEDLASDGFAFVPQDSLWVATLAYLAEVCAYLGDQARAAVLYDLLLPYDGRTVVVGGATTCFGAVARFLGMLAATLEDWDEAERHFRGAIELDEGTGAWPWLAHSQVAYADMVLQRSQEGDRRRAEALLDEAFIAAQRMGMIELMGEIEALKDR